MNYRVLIVDDDDESRLWLQRVLGGASFDAEAAASSSEAFGRIANDDIDLVITERQLARTDGLRFLWRV